jgi:hypothetical protein
MQQNNSSEAASCAATQVWNILWNPKVHYCVHKNVPRIPTLNQINPVHTTLSYLSKTHFNIIHQPLTSGRPSGLFPSGSPTNIRYAFLFSLSRAASMPVSSYFTWPF